MRGTWDQAKKIEEYDKYLSLTNFALKNLLKLGDLREAILLATRLKEMLEGL